MIRCRVCVMPLTRPDTPHQDGVCQACINYANRPAIDWGLRRQQLEILLEKHSKNGSGYTCIVPSSGGKDSHYQVLKLIELGAKPLVVTATTCHLTKIGRMNIDNLARYATTVEITPNTNTRKALNRIGLEMVGDISWPEHVSIFTTPFRVAAAMGIPLIFYGENPQDQYGGPQGTEAAQTMTRRWRSEFGGFLGLRVDDVEAMGYDMTDYRAPPETEAPNPPPGQEWLKPHAPDAPFRGNLEAHFLGQYLPWDSHENARVAKEAGMVQVLPTHANWWEHENLDNAQTGLHDHMMWRKYGYGRGCAQLSVDVRSGRMTRKRALEVIELKDGAFPKEYMGVSLDEVLGRIGVTRAHLDGIMDRFTDWNLFHKTSGGPVLKETA